MRGTIDDGAPLTKNSSILTSSETRNSVLSRGRGEGAVSASCEDIQILRKLSTFLDETEMPLCRAMVGERFSLLPMGESGAESAE